MDERFARALLQGPLEFGNEGQLQALALIRRLDGARTRLAHCKLCGGVGIVARGRPRRKQICLCLRGFPDDVVRALGIDIFAGHNKL